MAVSPKIQVARMAIISPPFRIAELARIRVTSIAAAAVA
jgi:hypothetical protein